jgi:predicted nucleic acid-binding Zn ribbon protein
LRDLLDPIGKKLGMEDAVDAGRLFARWPAIVGEDVAAHVEPTSLRDGILRVRADSPAWGTEIGYLADEIAGRINSALGSRVVTELRVSAGPRSAGASGTQKGPVWRPRAKTPREASEWSEVDPQEALERARRAWAAKNQKMHSDQDF